MEDGERQEELRKANKVGARLGWLVRSPRICARSIFSFLPPLSASSHFHAAASPLLLRPPHLLPYLHHHISSTSTPCQPKVRLPPSFSSLLSPSSNLLTAAINIGGGNAKKESGRAKKAANEDKKAAEAAARAEAAEAAAWEDSSKGKSAAEKKAEKAAEAARKAEEKKRLEAEDEASLPTTTPKSANKGKGAPKKSALKSGAPTGLDSVPSFTASNLDDALDAMSLVNERSDGASKGAAAGAIERHPERRFKAAFEAYKERELPILKEEHKGLRLQQYHDLLYKQFQKHPDNPFNQQTVAYDATKEEKLAALEQKRGEKERRLRDA